MSRTTIHGAVVMVMVIMIMSAVVGSRHARLIIGALVGAPHRLISPTTRTKLVYTSVKLGVCCNLKFTTTIYAFIPKGFETQIMAKDAIALLDHLGWKKAHVFGHSMGAMIACKVASMVPDRVLSLALLNVTGGGFECFPKLDRQTVSVAYRFLKAKTPEQRAAVDLDTHYSQEYLEEYVGTEKRRTILYQQYVKGISASGMQSNYGFEGQLNACWTHKMTQTEIEVIQSAGFLISVIHGRHDIIAQIYYAQKFAERLQPMARMVNLHGGHLVSHERPEEVNQALFDLIKASEVKMSPHDWTNLPTKQSWWKEKRMLFVRTNIQGGSNVSMKFCLLEKLHQCLIYFFGLLILAFDYARKLLQNFKPVRVGNSSS